MIYFIIFTLTILSCVIFDSLGIPTTLRRLSNSYKLQLSSFNSKTLNDEEKQKVLLSQVPVQLLCLLKLIWGILLFISPFLIFILVDNNFIQLEAEVIYRFEGIMISIIAVFLYILLKKRYGPVFKSGKNSS